MTFNDFLMVKCMEYTHALDDDLPDVYEDWIVEQDVEDIINWADEWYTSLMEEAVRYIKKVFNDRFQAPTPDDLEKLIEETIK